MRRSLREYKFNTSSIYEEFRKFEELGKEIGKGNFRSFDNTFFYNENGNFAFVRIEKFPDFDFNNLHVIFIKFFIV